MKALTPLTETNVADVMTSNAKTISTNATIAEVVKLMVVEGHTAIPVVNDRNACVGIISRSDLTAMFIQEDRELARVLEAGGSWAQYCAPLIDTCDEKRVRELMTQKVEAVSRTSTLQSTCQLMAEKKIHHLPVVDNNNAVVGIVSTLDIVKLIANEL